MLIRCQMRKSSAHQLLGFSFVNLSAIYSMTDLISMKRKLVSGWLNADTESKLVCYLRSYWRVKHTRYLNSKLITYPEELPDR